MPAGRRFFFVVAAATATVVAICSERNGSGVASSGGEQAEGAQKPNMGAGEAILVKNSAKNSTDYGTRRRARKLAPFISPTSGLIRRRRRNGMGIRLDVYIAAERQRGSTTRWGNKQETR